MNSWHIRLSKRLKVDKYDPRRSTSWRWELANYLMHGRTRPHRNCPDEYLRRACNLVMAFKRKRKLYYDRPQARRRLSVLIEAHELFQSMCWTKIEIECRLLAGEAIPAIAHRTRVRPRVVAAYSAIFFDIRQRLKARDYILGEIARRKEKLPCGVSVSWLFKMAYFGGSAVLDEVLGQLKVGGGSDLNVDEEIRGQLENLILLEQLDNADEKSQRLWLKLAAGSMREFRREEELKRELDVFKKPLKLPSDLLSLGMTDAPEADERPNRRSIRAA